ncbi:RHS repeat-associated core domain-containing protein [Lampropedia aestuarii]|uniref:RHS repeat-associated core domain-containing protein n=1 Tax=Lampropedia aestuarii TaxID=2562762 RepID=A0A4S5BI08_9BURK|nr:RHS repeat-associated core domain-containing protein [Lampropedia aestuarii]THJ30473.1 RHS repeat-associated core domain-containing protein [Lampropedia aestuarii]
MRLIEERRGSQITSYVYEPGSYVPLARLDASGDATEQGGLGTQADPAAAAPSAQQLENEARIAEALKGFEPTPHSGTGIAANDAEAQYWASLEQPDPRYMQEASLGNGTTGLDASSASSNPELCKVYYFHTDQVGMPEELTNADGQLVWQASYTTWGATVAEEWQVKTLANQEPIEQGDKPEGEQNLRFQGQYLDRSTGLHYNTFRYYDADMGRFICPDPIGLQGGINLATYAPNPLSWIDPWGWSCGKTKPIKFKRWKRGDAIDKPLPDGRTPTWDVVRSRYWKNRADAIQKSGSNEYEGQLGQMRNGKAPVDANGNPMELHHHNPQRNGGRDVNNPGNLREVTREQHAELDPYRNLGS